MKAVIDIGTNTFHLLIANVDHQNNINIIYKNTIAVKLGQGGVNKGYITEQAFARGISALEEFRLQLDNYQVLYVLATATAAVRDAANGQEFIKQAFIKAKIKISIIDGLQEAEYIYTGAKGAGVLSNSTDLIMDIGGGSVEFMICNQNQIFWKNSYQLGAARLLADFYQHHERLTKTVIEDIHQLFKSKLSDLFIEIPKYKPSKLIGTAGSFDSFATMISFGKPEVYDANQNRFFNFEKLEIMNLLQSIIHSNHEQRAKMNGLIPLRVDMILMASVITQFIINEFNIHQIVTCSYSLKEGLILSS